jgi:hypothetical protein
MQMGRSCGIRPAWEDIVTPDRRGPEHWRGGMSTRLFIGPVEVKAPVFVQLLVSTGTTGNRIATDRQPRGIRIGRRPGIGCRLRNAPNGACRMSGFDKNSSLRIGSSTAWVAETPGATAGYLEFHGQGLTTFERAMDRDEQLMAVLGTRMLKSRKRIGETAAAIELRQSGETAS